MADEPDTIRIDASGERHVTFGLGDSIKNKYKVSCAHRRCLGKEPVNLNIRPGHEPGRWLEPGIRRHNATIREDLSSNAGAVHANHNEAVTDKK